MVSAPEIVERLLYIGLAVFFAIALISLWRLNFSTHYAKFNLIDLITSREGRVSRPAVQEFGAFLVMTWGFIVLITKGQLAEWYVAIFVGCFVARAMHAAHLNATKPESPK